jgi:hypothetical protein
MSGNAQHINDFLRHLNLGAEVYYVGQLCDAWHMSTPGGGDLATFHLVCHGEAWIVMPDGGEPTAMKAGDIAFFANDAAHTFSAKPGIPEQACDYRHPAPLDKDAPGAGLLCGHMSLAPHIRRMLLASFPNFMLIRPDASPAGAQIRNLIEMMTEEAMQNDLGASAILDRLADTLFLSCCFSIRRCTCRSVDGRTHGRFGLPVAFHIFGTIQPTGENAANGVRGDLAHADGERHVAQ